MARFFSRSNYYRVLEGGLLIILGHYLTVTKWRPNFRLSMESIQSTLVWIRFPKLPLELFDEEVLSALGNALGKAVKIDATTLQISRGKYARVCVKINLAAPLVLFIMVLDCKQRVEYEGLFLICFECGKYGHHPRECSPTATVSQPTVVQQESEEGSESNKFGPRMLPKNKYRRQQKVVTDRAESAANRPSLRDTESRVETTVSNPAVGPKNDPGSGERN